MTTPQSHVDRSAEILADLQIAVTAMHVVSASDPRVVVATTSRHGGPRPMAWQVLFQRSLAPQLPRIVYRGASAGSLAVILSRGFDDEPTLNSSWSHERLGDAMKQGPVIQAFRADRLPDDVENALVGLLIFEEDGLQLNGVKALAALVQESLQRMRKS